MDPLDLLEPDLRHIAESKLTALDRRLQLLTLAELRAVRVLLTPGETDPLATPEAGLRPAPVGPAARPGRKGGAR